MGNLGIICEKNSIKRFSTGSCSIRSLVSPKKKSETQIPWEKSVEQVKVGYPESRYTRISNTIISFGVSFGARSLTGGAK